MNIKKEIEMKVKDLVQKMNGNTTVMVFTKDSEFPRMYSYKAVDPEFLNKSFEDFNVTANGNELILTIYLKQNAKDCDKYDK